MFFAVQQMRCQKQVVELYTSQNYLCQGVTAQFLLTCVLNFEVLAAIKTEGVLDSERKKDRVRGMFSRISGHGNDGGLFVQDVEEVLGSISDEYFAELFRSVFWVVFASTLESLRSQF